MKVTIITVTYNSAKFLEGCINSVLMQDYNDIEYIIIDGCSGDDTVSIIKKYENKISKWVSEKDGGMYEAINKGMKMASGSIIGLLNSDDLLASKDVISSIVNCFVEQKVDCIYSDLVYVDRLNTQKINRYWKGLEYKRNRFNYGWMPAHSTFYVRKEIIEQLGDYESNFFTAADYEFMSRLLYKNRISAYYMPKLSIKMRSGGASNISLYNRLKANRIDYLSMKKNKVPFPFLVSLLKPISKLNQYYYTFFNRIL